MRWTSDSAHRNHKRSMISVVLALKRDENINILRAPRLLWHFMSLCGMSYLSEKHKSSKVLELSVLCVYLMISSPHAICLLSAYSYFPHLSSRLVISVEIGYIHKCDCVWAKIMFNQHIVIVAIQRLENTANASTEYFS